MSKEWTYKDELHTFEGEPEDGLEDKITMTYSSDTPNSYYVTIYTSYPVDSWGSKWDMGSECLCMSRDDVHKLIEKLQKFVQVPDNKALVVLEGENK